MADGCTGLQEKNVLGQVSWDLEFSMLLLSGDLLYVQFSSGCIIH